jgi:hypothetical protein
MLAFLVARHGGAGYLETHLHGHALPVARRHPPAAGVRVVLHRALHAGGSGFWQARASRARDPGIARRGVLISIACWVVFDFLTPFTGMYARAALPGLARRFFAFPELARVTLPAGALGLFYWR